MRKIAFFVILLTFCGAVTAFAIDLRTAKAKGLVGETVTGYLAPVVPPTQEVQQLISSINAKRHQHYAAIAKRNKTALKTVETLAGKKAIDKTPPGYFIQVNGAWKKK